MMCDQLNLANQESFDSVLWYAVNINDT